MKQNMKSKKWIALLILAIIIFIIAYFVYARYQSGQVMVTSISSDGHYAITTDLSRKAILWNLKNHTKEILDRKANIYSAYFIKNSNNFMWQYDPNNEVIIRNVNGQIIKTFNPGIATYGEIITTDLKHYYASDENWNIYYYDGSKTTQISKGFLSFLGSQKLLNWSLSQNDSVMLSSGACGAQEEEILLNQLKGRDNLNCIVLWHPQFAAPLKKFTGNQVKTFATLSPDGKYIVAGDEDRLNIVWRTFSGKQIFRSIDLDGKGVEGKNGIYHTDYTSFIPMPNDFEQYDGGNVFSIFSLKFIDNTHYLRFTTYVPNYAILYLVTDPKPLKYLSLGRSPKISVDDYTRDQSIDTSPQAHILVTGKINAGGILVYQYDLKTQTLNKVWNGW